MDKLADRYRSRNCFIDLFCRHQNAGAEHSTNGVLLYAACCDHLATSTSYRLVITCIFAIYSRLSNRADCSYHAFDALYMLEREASILFALAVSIALIGYRTYCQSLSDRSQLSGLLLLVLAPAMSLITLLYVDEFMQGYLWYWTTFCALMATYYVVLGQRARSLALECSAVMHALIVGIAFVWLSDTWLTTAISIQVAIMALQAQVGLFRPASWAIKVAMGILVIRLTLLPFIPEWQPVEAGHWAWVLVSYMPSLFILSYARSTLKQVDRELTNWFEGAFLHVFLMALFTQTNYWLTGQYGYLGHIDFTSAAVFANQALVMGLVYSYRSQFAQRLSRIYEIYSYLLWCAFAILIILLNTAESPLVTDNVSAQALPIFNMLSIGWLLPACILLIATFKRWNTLQVHRFAIASLGFLLAAIWLGMSIRQFWQTTSMMLYQPTSMAELFSYSVAGLLVGGLLTWRGVTQQADDAACRSSSPCLCRTESILMGCELSGWVLASNKLLRLRCVFDSTWMAIPEIESFGGKSTRALDESKRDSRQCAVFVIGGR